MYLKRCDIENFRSIRKLTISFEDRFKILVGLNESGKTNILKALSFLEPSILPGEDDIRDTRHDESPISNAYVRFVFGLEPCEVKTIFKALQPLFKAKRPKSSVIKIGSKDYSLEEFCEYRKEGLYIINLLNKKKYPKYWSFRGPQFIAAKSWKEIPPKWVGYTKFPSSDFKFISVDDYPEHKDDATLTDLTLERLTEVVGLEILELISRQLFQCIVWRYSESNLLPARIDVPAFAESPESCEPLRNIFYMSGFKDIEKAIEDAEAKKNGMRNLLRKLSDNATKHLRKVWPEYNRISIDLTQNGGVIETGVLDEYNVYSLERRSDGFKRFITFLLMISAKAKAEHLTNTLIIIDEPDIGLHPSGIQYLREELKKISKDNIVIIATHSIFMIDKDRIDRHLIVKKEKEETTTSSDYNTSDMLDEEVIYRALGYSLFDIFKKRNVIFEGWTDKHIFKLWLNSTAPQNVVKKQWKDIGLLHAFGAKDVSRVARDLENLSREYIVLSDADAPSKEKQKVFNGSHAWITYQDLGFQDKETIEDFLDVKFIDAQILAVLRTQYTDKEIVLDPKETFNTKLCSISSSLSLIKDDSLRLKKLIKNTIHEKITAKHIRLADLVNALCIESDETFKRCS